jgi:hypothetical protein
MSLRTYFDAALTHTGSADDRRRARSMSIKKGADAQRALKQARASLTKLRAHKARRQKAYA